MGSGGIFKERSSLRLSDLMPPTAFLACSRTGWTSSSSFSTSALRTVISASSLLSFEVSCSTSLRLSTARSIDF
eukprot:scaffold87093_cov25-Tisochrysis_lutea.AAC.1